MPKSKFKQTPVDSAVCVVYEPHFFLESRSRVLIWLSVYFCLWLKCFDFSIICLHVYITMHLIGSCANQVWQTTKENIPSYSACLAGEYTMWIEGGLHWANPRSMEKKGDTTDAALPNIWLYTLCRRCFIFIRNIQTRLLYTW